MNGKNDVRHVIPTELVLVDCWRTCTSTSLTVFRWASSREHGAKSIKAVARIYKKLDRTDCLYIEPPTPPRHLGILPDARETRQKEKGRAGRPVCRAYPAYKCQYTPPEPGRHKNGEIQTGSGHVHITACSLLPGARAAPTRTPMLRENR
ncbi:hypothetical protein J3F84DRAFT_266516 [Trichoderma pleuroticola]